MNLDIEDRVRVQLIGTDVERGFIDFARAGRGQGGLKFASPGGEVEEGGLFVFVLNDT